MPQYFCVPKCNNKKGSHLFPNTDSLKLRWRFAIRPIDPVTKKWRQQCLMSQPVQNLSKFSLESKAFRRFQLTGNFSCRWGCLPRCWRLARWARWFVALIDNALQELTRRGSGPCSSLLASRQLWVPADCELVGRPITCWSPHSSWSYWQIPICVFLWSIKCQHSVWQQRLLH